MVVATFAAMIESGHDRRAAASERSPMVPDGVITSEWGSISACLADAGVAMYGPHGAHSTRMMYKLALKWPRL